MRIIFFRLQNATARRLTADRGYVADDLISLLQHHRVRQLIDYLHQTAMLYMLYGMFTS